MNILSVKPRLNFPEHNHYTVKVGESNYWPKFYSRHHELRVIEVLHRQWVGSPGRGGQPKDKTGRLVDIQIWVPDSEHRMLFGEIIRGFNVVLAEPTLIDEALKAPMDFLKKYCAGTAHFLEAVSDPFPEEFRIKPQPKQDFIPPDLSASGRVTDFRQRYTVEGGWELPGNYIKISHEDALAIPGFAEVYSAADLSRRKGSHNNGTGEAMSVYRAAIRWDSGEVEQLIYVQHNITGHPGNILKIK